jgi:catechol 2,3-dioxygenase-like lactoylglutathione lyase family enzyme
MVKELAFTAYPCADVAATRAWYERNLGLTFAGPYIEDGMEKYNEAHIGSGCFSLMWNGWMDAAAGTGNGVAFEVSDIERRVVELTAAGIAVDPLFVSPMCKSTSLRDPEGNRLTIHETDPARTKV